MKKTLVILVAFLIEGWPLYAQQDTSLYGSYGWDASKDYNFFFSVGPGLAFSAPGKNLTAYDPMPTLQLTVGYSPGLALLGVTMRGLTPYSPALRDSSLAWRDTVSYYHKFWAKSAVLVGTIGLHSGGDGGLGGGLSTSAGVTFMEKNNKIYAPFLWEFSLEGEYGFNEVYSVVISSTYSYVFSSVSEQFGTDGFAVILEAKFKYRF